MIAGARVGAVGGGRYLVTFRLVEEWTDSRLTWRDLNPDMTLNLPGRRAADHKLWFPNIVIVNSEHSTQVTDVGTSTGQYKNCATLLDECKRTFEQESNTGSYSQVTATNNKIRAG